MTKTAHSAFAPSSDASTATPSAIVVPQISQIVSPFPQPGAGGQVLTVGVGGEFATLSDAIAAATDNSVIAVLAGSYTDASNAIENNVITAANVTIVGVGGTVRYSEGSQGIANGKGLLVATNGLTLQNFDIEGARQAPVGTPTHSPLAGVWIAGGNLTLMGDTFGNNDNGVAGGNAGSVVTVRHTSFVGDGNGAAGTGGINVAGVASLTVTNDVFSGTLGGSDLKSQSGQNFIQKNFFETTGVSITIANGGVANIGQNMIQRVSGSISDVFIRYGGNALFTYATNQLSVTQNSFLNESGLPGVAVLDTLNQTFGSQSAPTDKPIIDQNGLWNMQNGAGAYWMPPGSQVLTQVASIGTNQVLTTEPVFFIPQTLGYGLPVETPAPGILTLSSSGHTVTGGTTRLQISDQAGGNIFDSGSASGISLSAYGTQDSVNTQAGTSNQIGVSGQSTVTSAGQDFIVLLGSANQATVSGSAIVINNGYATLDVTGMASVTGLGSIGVTIEAGGQASVIDNAGTDHAVVAGGGSLTFQEAGIQGGTPFARAAISGLGGATVTGSNGATPTVRITTGNAGESIKVGNGNVEISSNGADTVFAGNGNTTLIGGSAGLTVQFGLGSTTVVGGTGVNAYQFMSGHGGGTDVIFGFRPGTDTLNFSGFSGGAIASESVSGGSTSIALTDGTHIQLVGAALPLN